MKNFKAVGIYMNDWLLGCAEKELKTLGCWDLDGYQKHWLAKMDENKF